MNTVQFDVTSPATITAILADVRLALQFFPMAGVKIKPEIVAPDSIVWVSRCGGQWDNDRRLITLSEGLRSPDRILALVNVVAHELTHAQQVATGTYQHLTGWDRMMAYARCPFELQANLVAQFCTSLWDARMHGRSPENSPAERWQAVADWVMEHQLERIRNAQAELATLKGLSDAELYPHSRRLGLSWRPTSG